MSVFSEQIAIGKLLTGNGWDLCAGLKSSHFTDQWLADLYSRIAAKAIAGKSYDIVALYDDDPSLILGDMVALSKNAPGDESIVETAVDGIKADAMRRNLVGIANDILAMAAGRESTEQIRERIEHSLQTIDEGKRHAKQLKDAMRRAVDEIERRSKGDVGIKTGIASIDEIMIGMREGELHIIAARPGMGKTALAMNIAAHVAKSATVFIASAEMTDSELATRIMVSGSGANYRDVRSGMMEAHDLDRFMSFMLASKNLPMYIDDTPSPTYHHVAGEAKRIKRLHGLGLVVVDYLGLLRGEGRSRTEEVGYVSRSLKGLAKELNCPIIALQQLSRKCEERADKRPAMSDLRDSGEIEQDADSVAMLYRDSVYDKASKYGNHAELIFRKSRGFAGATAWLEWDGSRQRFATASDPIIDTQKTGGYRYGD